MCYNVVVELFRKLIWHYAPRNWKPANLVEYFHKSKDVEVFFMKFSYGKSVKVISAQSAEEFESKLNEVLNALNRESITYELKLDPQCGFVAFIIADVRKNIYETVKEAFEEGGEIHYCIECPFFERPTNGNRKYTKCKYDGRMCKGDKSCCEYFYQQLYDGKIAPIEIDERLLGK